MADRTWKARERKAAAAIGARRQRCSGSSGVPGQTRSDSDHPRVYLESKHRQRHAVISLWDDTAKKAAKEEKVPLVCLSVKHRPGRWWLVHHRHIAAAVVEWLSQQDEETLSDVTGRVWAIRNAGKD